MQFKAGQSIDFKIPRLEGGNNTECNKDVKETKFNSSPVLLLPWVKGGINYTESAGKDVVSGLFTGCIMGVYKRGGVRRVCHVATPECKDAWEKLKGETGVEVIKEFKPSDHLPDLTKKQLEKGGVEIYGHVTADDKCFAVICSRDKSMKLSVLTVEAVK